eukprot:14478727-Alexandrium_andersonii.AAC.1
MATNSFVPTVGPASVLNGRLLQGNGRMYTRAVRMCAHAAQARANVRTCCASAAPMHPMLPWCLA